MTTADEADLTIFERKILRKIYGLLRTFLLVCVTFQIAAAGENQFTHEHNQSATNVAAIFGPSTPQRDHKALLIKRTCAEFLAQMELLHLQIDKPPKVLAKSEKKKFQPDGSFHQAVGRVLLFAEFFAFMPVKGVTASQPSQLSFSWTNLRTLYCLLFILTTTIDLGLSINKLLYKPINFNSVEPLIFRMSIIVVCISAIVLARKWPALMLYWDEMESDLPEYLTQMEKGRLAYRIKIVTIVAMMLSLAEHLLNIISNILYSNACPQSDDPIKDYFILTNQQIFDVFPYSVYLAICGKLENIICTFIWNFMDVFVMIVSLGLAAKFKQLNDNLFKFKGMQMPEIFWLTRRKQYRNLCELCARIDGAISLITMISFSNNLYFICVQLLRSLNKMPSFAQLVYFYFSLFFLIGRTLAVSLCSASINDESRKPLRVLRCIPKESWCTEVKRFSEDINSDLVALSGMKFFYLTRKLVLSVAGTIVTYELVLIQFHQDGALGECVSNLRPQSSASNGSAH
ncbi:gustatory receptor for sugar taste 64f-like [Rhagoletis pomonella]|uniref:gustatory receptor for sugar taste 64f-like n=1 Tax=Rhagoletis pomonella TaxID=28610 RepID=UPI00177B4761|nr:gustatory receptor for sugar taste 64f-like [Rhagoletis pomonella]